MTELVVVVVCRGSNAPADAVRIVNTALAMTGVQEIRIERKDT
jgi:hypothetical protein